MIFANQECVSRARCSYSFPDLHGEGQALPVRWCPCHLLRYPQQANLRCSDFLPVAGEASCSRRSLVMQARLQAHALPGTHQVRQDALSVMLVCLGCLSP
jgi:hypothetical protein